MALSLVLDTDIGTDVDDAFALAFALRHPRIDLRAVTTVSGDAVRRAQIAAKLLRLAGREDVEVAVGLGSPRPPSGRSAWMGHEGDGLLAADERLPVSVRDATTLIVDEARRARMSGEKLRLAGVGLLTNLAAALETDPELARGLERIAVMGGMLARVESGGRTLPASAEHNLTLDPAAAVTVLTAELPTLLVPLDVTVRTRVVSSQVERLRNGDELCRGLARLIDIWAPILRARAPGLPADQVAVLHDPLTVAALAEPDLVAIERLPLTVTVIGGAVRTLVDPVAGRPTDVVTAADSERFERLWLDTVLGG
jgi:purine nucleosidase